VPRRVGFRTHFFSAITRVEAEVAGRLEEQQRQSIEREVEQHLAAAMPAVDLLEVVVTGRGDRAMLRTVIDHPDGVTHDLCAEVTHVLDRAGMRDRFGIEVWSPGPERPLRTLEHFRRAIGRRVTIRPVRSPRWARRSITGTLVTVDGESLGIDEGGERIEIARGDVHRARITPDAPQA
jgi:ribosome maturation factor RimP